MYYHNQIARITEALCVARTGLAVLAGVVLLTLGTATAPAAPYTGTGPGTSTINAGGGADYTSLSAAIADLNATPLTGGAWVFEIASNVTEGAGLSINQTLNGNTVTFRPAAATTPTVDITGGITVTDTTGLIWDGSNSGGTSRDLTLNMTAAFTVVGESDGFVAENLIMNVGFTFNGDGSNAPDNGLVDNCAITASGFSIFNAGGSPDKTGLVYSNNDITATGTVRVFSYQNTNNHSIIGNTVSQTVTASGFDQTSILWNFNCDSYTVDSNVFDINFSGTGGAAACRAFEFFDAGTYTYSNNFFDIEVAGGGDLGNMNVVNVNNLNDGENATVNFLHNSVYFRSTGVRNDTSPEETSGIQLPSDFAGTADIRNNVMVSGWQSDDVTASAFFGFNGTGGTITCDYNLLYIDPASVAAGAILGSFGGTDYADLAGWNAGTGFGANSAEGVDARLLWTSAADYHFGTQPSMGDTDWIGTFIGSVTTDIDGDARDPLQPTKGADEAVGLEVDTWILY